MAQRQVFLTEKDVRPAAAWVQQGRWRSTASSQKGSAMAQRRIYITKDDAKKLEALLKAGLRHNGNRDLANLRVLQEELGRARIVGGSDVTPDVVTMHSCVRVKDLYDDEAMEMTLVFPEEADPDEGRISVVAPIGSAVLGYKTGDTVQFRTPGGLRRLHIEQVLYQPEAAGQVHA